ncbi:sigma factor-like helix-turn-helix DNA-binding protein [Streptomyces sp. MS06]|uniref:sigma factor-like helix-turn-helix DNA-binding protein n=1 Tax=Streptomyces sp. MS06 TaxID=3385974 RepID=UPI0039A3B7F8
MTQSPATPLPPPKERRRLREAGALTQAQLAAQVGVSRDTVRAWESGRTTPRGRKRDTYATLLASLAKPTRAQGSNRTAAGGGRTGPATARRDGERRSRRAGADRSTRRARVGRHGSPVDSPADGPPVEPADPARAAGAAGAAGGFAVADIAGGVGGGSGGAGPSGTAGTPSGTAAVPSGTAGEQSGSDTAGLTPTQAFDELYAFCAPALVRQTYLLTGRRGLARESVEGAFQQAWQRWPEVARDPDPAGWVRAAAYEYALSPWHRLRPRHRHTEQPPAETDDRTLLNLLLRLPPPYRRTLLLHDGVGIGLPETAAETEASTRAAANRLLHAREALAAGLPDLADPAELHRRLAELASTGRQRAARAPAVRTGGERRARFWTRAAIAFTAAIVGATALTLRTAPTRYEAPIAPGETVQGVPPPAAPGPLSDADRALRTKLRSGTEHGPERLVPEGG